MVGGSKSSSSSAPYADEDLSEEPTRVAARPPEEPVEPTLVADSAHLGAAAPASVRVESDDGAEEGQTRLMDSGRLAIPETPSSPPSDLAAPEDSAEPTRIGGRLVGNYRTVRSLGSGGMANVFEAVHVRTGERVALKLLLESVASVSEIVSRFVREGRALRNVAHPNIVQVFDQGITESGDAWIAMELLKGRTLETLVAKGPLPASHAIPLLTDVAKALATVHAKGIVHRDIKPENVFVVDEGLPTEHAKIIDFGVARVTQAEMGEYSAQHTQAGSLLGSAVFMSPEQLACGEIDARSDVFAFGVTMYEVLTGALPFTGDTLVEQVRARTKGTITPIGKHRVAEPIDPRLEDLIVRCLAGDPARRPADGLALLKELRALAPSARLPRSGATPVAAPKDEAAPASSREPAPRVRHVEPAPVERRKRSPWLPLAAAVVVLVGVAALLRGLGVL